MVVRLDPDLQKILRDGARRTPLKKQELIRLTLRRHLREVIDQEALVKSPPRITNIKPWSKRVVEKAYRRIGKDWDALEDAAIRAQGKPDVGEA